MNTEEYTEDVIEGIVKKYGYEKRSGRIMFKPPAMQLVCKALDIKYSDLSKTGRVILRGDMIEQFMGRTPPVTIDGNYYLNK